MNKKQEGGINISNSSVNIGGDMVGRDKVEVIHTSHTEFAQSLLLWEKNMNEEVSKVDLSQDEKEEIKQQLAAIKSAVLQDKDKKPARLEKLLNILAVMSPDIFDVAVATLVNPLAGIGLTLRKISDKAKVAIQTS